MAKLIRVTNKVFGSSADPNISGNPEISQFGSGLAHTFIGTDNVAEIQALEAWDKGWIDAVTAEQQFPALSEMTGAMKVLSYQTAYDQQMGIPEWDSDTTYYTNSFCQVDGAIYKSLVDDNTNHNPTEESSEYWTEFKTGGGYHPNIFDMQWSDHLINDIQWLRADTFSWQSGDVYETAYNKLVEEYATGSEETEGSITFKRTTNGFKIADASMESAILSKYNSDGIAWYYILDTTNKQFKLPRAKNKYLIDIETSDALPVKGNGLALGVTNGTVNMGLANAPTAGIDAWTGNYGKSVGTSNSGSATGDYSRAVGVTTNSSKSGIIADASGISANIEETGFYLYFYVGEYTQTAIEQTAGITSEQLNNKADKDLGNVTNPTLSAPYLKESYVNGLSGYNVWSNGYCEQWGYVYTITTINLLKKFKDVNYAVLFGKRSVDSQAILGQAYDFTTSSFNFTCAYNGSYTAYPREYNWLAIGYLAEGEY